MSKTIIFKKALRNVFRKNDFLLNIYNKLHVFKRKRIVKKTISDLEKVRTYSSEEIFALQNTKLTEILKYAYSNTIYYKHLFDQSGIIPSEIEAFKKVPFLTKEKIRNNQKKMISKNYQIEHLGRKNTGGSTGEPLEFYCNTEAGLIDFGHHWYLYKLMGHKEKDIIVGCGGAKIPENDRKKNIYWIKKPNGNVFGDYLFSVLYLTDKNIGFYLEKIIELKPAILRGYPSFYDSLAQYILKNKIKLDFDIKGINLTAEMCSNQQRANIENAFSTMVYFEYGHSEVALYCYTSDDSYIYKSSPIYGYIEVLNDDGTETQVGEVGNIVVTGFLNKGMPFIRYVTGDLGELHKRNAGSVELKTIFGRSQDYIISKTKEKVYLTALIFGQHLKAFSNMKKWQITQSEIGKISINIVKGPAYTKLDEIDIIDKILSVTEIDIDFNYVIDIPRTKSGKHLFLIQKLTI